MNEANASAGRANGSEVGDKNLYICDRCNGVTVVIHRDPGTTPMFMSCRQKNPRSGEYCTKRAVSAMYPPEPWPEGIRSEPEYEWYRPSEQQIKNSPPEQREYYELGGLDLHRIGDSFSDGPHRIPGQRMMTRRERRHEMKMKRKRGRGWTK